MRMTWLVGASLALLGGGPARAAEPPRAQDALVAQVAPSALDLQRYTGRTPMIAMLERAGAR